MPRSTTKSRSPRKPVIKSEVFMSGPMRLAWAAFKSFTDAIPASAIDSIDALWFALLDSICGRLTSYDSITLAEWAMVREQAPAWICRHLLANIGRRRRRAASGG